MNGTRGVAAGLAAKRKHAGEEDQELEDECNVYMDEMELEDLPMVDDLEIAALAAGPSDLEDSSEEDSSDSEATSSPDNSDDESMPSKENGLMSTKSQQNVKLKLQEQDGKIYVGLEVADGMESDGESIAESDIVEQEDFKRLLADMLQLTDESRSVAKEAEEAKAEFEQDPIAPLEIEITPNEPTNPVGKISAVLEGSHIIVQAPLDAKVLAEDSVLCLEDRQPLGRIEEILGPVAEPLYSLRYAGPSPMPKEVIQGANVSCFSRYTTYLLDDELQVGAQGPEDDSDAEHFSDDDAEVLMQQMDTHNLGENRVKSKPVSEVGDLGEHQYRKKLNVGSPRFIQQKAERPLRQPQKRPNNRGRSASRDSVQEESKNGGKIHPPKGGRWVWMPEGENPNPPINPSSVSPNSGFPSNFNQDQNWRSPIQMPFPAQNFAGPRGPQWNQFSQWDQSGSSYQPNTYQGVNHQPDHRHFHPRHFARPPPRPPQNQNFPGQFPPNINQPQHHANFPPYNQYAQPPFYPRGPQ